MAHVTDAPPPTQVEPVGDVLHGVKVIDPYRWLEDQDSPRTRKWIEDQTAYTRRYFDAIPGRERIRNRVEELLAVEVRSDPWKVGERYFFLKRKAHQEQPAIMMSESLSSEDVVLVDPSHKGKGNDTTVDIIEVSRDGRFLAYGVRSGGRDSESVEIFDVYKKTTLSDRLPIEECGAPVFSSDANGFYYVRPLIDQGLPSNNAVYWHTFGTDSDQDLEVFSVGHYANKLVTYGSPDGRYLAHYAVLSEDPQRTNLYLQDLSQGASAELVINELSGTFWPVFAGRGLVALTELGAPNYRVVYIDLSNPSPSLWREVVPESDARIQEFAVVNGLIFVAYLQNASSRIEIFDLTGRKRGTFPNPSWSSSNFLAWQPDSDTLFYRFSSYSHPPEIRCYHTNSGEHETWARSQVPYDSSSVDVEQVMYPSKDDTLVPMLLVSQKGRGSAPLPTVLTGYGGFGASLTPQFSAFGSYLVEHGCRFAAANLRGGAEFGEQWHRAGKRKNKQKSIEDFIGAAEWLLEQDRTVSGQLAIVGGSNAGLLVGAAMTQKPELFRAVLCLGPLLDMLRYHHFDGADRWTHEYGSAENADDFQALSGYSPYHKVLDATAYPATLLVSGDSDTRCNPMHARKMAARLQVANASRHPILLDYKPSRGHMPTQPLTSRIDALTDRLAFLCHELGLHV